LEFLRKFIQNPLEKISTFIFGNCLARFL